MIGDWRLHWLLIVGDGIDHWVNARHRSLAIALANLQCAEAVGGGLLLCGAALLIVYAAVRLFWFGAVARPVADSAFFEGLLKVIVWVPPSLGVMMVWARASLHEAWRQLGLHAPVAPGWVFGAIATLPMALAALLRGPWLPDLDDLVGTVLLGPFAEEVLFRGFLFTVLWRRVGWSWPVALTISAAAFGLAHVWRFDLWTPLAALAAGYPDHAYESSPRSCADSRPSPAFRPRPGCSSDGCSTGGAACGRQSACTRR